MPVKVHGHLPSAEGILGRAQTQPPSKPDFSGLIPNASRALRSDLAEIPASVASAFTCFAGSGPLARMSCRKSDASALSVLVCPFPWPPAPDRP